MAVGAGKYDDLCTQVREGAKARGAVVIVIGGENGGGFSCQADAETTRALPEMLENIAAQIRADREAALHQVAAEIRKEFGFDPE